jgi:hypothetical protein
MPQRPSAWSAPTRRSRWRVTPNLRPCPLPDVAVLTVFARCKGTVRRDVTALDVPGTTALPFRRIAWAGLNSTRRIDL